MAELGKRKVEVGPGDFIGWPKESEPHTMYNPFRRDLVYLMGGTRKPIDISEYPRSRKRTYKFAGRRHTVGFDATEEE